jgi:hypothetical protein
MGFLKKLIGQEPLMKTILGKYDLMTTNLENDLEELKIKDISAIAQIQVILHTVNESAFRIELKTLEKSTILEGMKLPENYEGFTHYRLTDFKGTGEYLLKISINDLRVHSFKRNITLRYVNLNLGKLNKKNEKLKKFKERSMFKERSSIFSRTESKTLIKLEDELKIWLKEQTNLWNQFGNIYDILPKYITFEYEDKWYENFIEKYGNNIIQYILKDHTEKIKHIPKKEIEIFLHLQEKLFKVRILKGSQDKKGKSIYDFITEIRKKEIQEKFSSHFIENKALIDFSIEYEKINENDYDILNEIEELNEDDGMLAYVIFGELSDFLNNFYQNSKLTLNDLKQKFQLEYKKAIKRTKKFKNEESKQLFLSIIERDENFIKEYSE